MGVHENLDAYLQNLQKLFVTWQCAYAPDEKTRIANKLEWIYKSEVEKQRLER